MSDSGLLANINANSATVLSAVQSGSLSSILGSMLKPGYSITFNTIANNTQIGGTIGQPVFTPTNWVSLQESSGAAVVTAPIELGGYASINKVRHARQLNVVFTLEGYTGYSGNIPNLNNFSTLTRAQLLFILEEMRTSTNTYNIATPDMLYESFDLEQFDYSMSSGNGITLLRVNATFVEVIPVTSSLISTKSLLNKNSSQGTAITTEKVNSGTSTAGLDEINNAFSSATGMQSVDGTGVTSGMGNASTMIGQTFSASRTQAAHQSANGVQRLLGALT